MRQIGVFVVLFSLFLYGCGSVGTQPGNTSGNPLVVSTQAINTVVSPTPGRAPDEDVSNTDVLVESQPHTGPQPPTERTDEIPPSDQLQQPTQTGAQSGDSTPSKSNPQPTAQSMTVNYWNQMPSLVDKGKMVVLTFDDGPTPWTPQLVQTLNEENVPAVMFWNTYHIQFATDEVTTMLKHSPNITIGDHTVNHPNLLQLGYIAQQHEIVDAKSVIENTIGSPVVLFRPPYGNYNQTTTDVLNAAHMQCVMWNDDSLDWKYPNNVNAVIHQIQSNLHPGAVILMHDHQDTIRELPQIIAMLRHQGYGFTTFAGLH